MNDAGNQESTALPENLREQIGRQQKIIDALMRRAERTNSAGTSAFSLFETTITLEDEVRRRTDELNAALRENEKVNRTLQQTQSQMEQEITERRRAQQALELANRKLEALTLTEPLTGLSNRRNFDRVLGAEWARALQHQKPLGAAMIDIDKFKLYNDRYGHLAGDDCLRKVAAAIQRSVRHRDLVARYGGEEIVLVLPGAELETAGRIGERTRAEIAGLALPHEDYSHGIVTVSIGVASLVPTGNTEPARLITLADEALYQAKAEGRNRVCLNHSEQ